MENQIATPEQLPAAIPFVRINVESPPASLRSRIPLEQINVESPTTFSQVSSDIILNEINSLIPNNIWTARIQDKGGTYDELGSKTYKRNKIMSIGPESKKNIFSISQQLLLTFAKLCVKHRSWMMAGRSYQRTQHK